MYSRSTTDVPFLYNDGCTMMVVRCFCPCCYDIPRTFGSVYDRAIGGAYALTCGNILESREKPAATRE